MLVLEVLQLNMPLQILGASARSASASALSSMDIRLHVQVLVDLLLVLAAYLVWIVD